MSKRELIMLVVGILIGALVVYVVWYENPDPSDWLEIESRVLYSEDGLEMDHLLHDVGISGPGETVSWVLE